MQNVNMTVKGKKLVIEIDLDTRLGPSSSGKTILVASTGGSVPIPGMPEIKLGVNAFVSPAKATKAA